MVYVMDARGMLLYKMCKDRHCVCVDGIFHSLNCYTMLAQCCSMLFHIIENIYSIDYLP